MRESASYEEIHSRALALFSSTFVRSDILDGVLTLLAQRAPYPLSAIYLYDDWRGCYALEASRGAPADMKQTSAAVKVCSARRPSRWTRFACPVLKPAACAWKPAWAKRSRWKC